MKHGTVQIDYVFAISAFILTFALIIQYTTDYYTETGELTDLMLLRNKAMNLMMLADCSYEDYPCLQSHAYRFYIVVNNTQENLINQSHPVSDLADELVIFDLYDIHESPDLNSVAITYDGLSVNYQRTGSEISFVTDIMAGETRIFTVYFDDDSSFADRSVPVSGSNNLTEKIYPIEKIYLLQYSNLEEINSLGYDPGYDFNLTLYDQNSQVFFTYGKEAPKRGNVVALQKHVAYQNSFGDVNLGKFVVQLW